MAVTTIIAESEQSHLQNWKDYIAEYDQETSKTSSMDLSGLGTPLVPADVTMESVLDLMAQAAGEVLLFAHGSSNGLIMRIAANSNSSEAKYLKGISRAWKAIDEIIAIRKMPENPPTIQKYRDLVQNLAKYLKELDSGYGARLGNTNDVNSRASADKWFDQWMVLMAKACLGGGLGENDLRRVCRAMQGVRNKKLNRVEIRACNIGSNVATLAAYREFFGATKIVAPKVTMFFGKAPANVNPGGDMEALIKIMGGYRNNQFTAATSNKHNHNTVADGEPDVKTGKRNRVFPNSTAAPDAIMQVTEVAPYTYKSRLWAPSNDAVTRFLGANYKSGKTFKTGAPIPVGGLWCPDHSTVKVPFVLPLESEYRDLLESNG